MFLLLNAVAKEVINNHFHCLERSNFSNELKGLDVIELSVLKLCSY